MKEKDQHLFINGKSYKDGGTSTSFLGFDGISGSLTEQKLSQITFGVKVKSPKNIEMYYKTTQNFYKNKKRKQN